MLEERAIQRGQRSTNKTEVESMGVSIYSFMNHARKSGRPWNRNTTLTREALALV